jgi:hypothetical protein
MAKIIWITPAGDLGVISELLYYEKQFDAYNSLGGSVTYSIIAGSLPPGLSLSSTGLLNGIPNSISKATEYTFAVRASNGVVVSDRTFTITVANSVIPELKPVAQAFADQFITDYVDIQFYIEPPNPLTDTSLPLVYSLQSGTLPAGLTLTSDGRLFGYLRAPQSFSIPYSPGYDAAANPSLELFDNTFDITVFDYTGAFNDVNYQFNIQVTDGTFVDVNTYTMLVQVNPAGYNPILFNPEGSIGSIRQNTNFAYKFDAVDYNGQELTYVIVNYPGATGLPDGLSLNPATGWLTGYVSNTAVGTGTITANTVSNVITGTGTLFDVELKENDVLFVSNVNIGTVSNIVSNTELILSNVSTSNLSASTYSYTVGLKTLPYTFGVRVYETTDPSFTTGVQRYSVTVKGDIPNTVEWITDANIGDLYGGEISTLSISATTPSGLTLTYHLVEGSYGALPVGLILLPDGNISGRVTFDLGATSQTYTFTVAAYDENVFAYGEKTFTITVIKRDNEPYENLYLQILPNRSQRDIYDTVIDNQVVFPDDHIYRLNDPWFGKNTLRRVLFMTGLNTEEMAKYIDSMTFNHYWKNINFGDIKTARALDSNLNPMYEVVYVELIDDQVNAEGNGPPLSVYLPDSKWTTGAWRTADTTDIIDDSTIITADAAVDGITIYPNSFPNMVQRVGDGIGYENRSILPSWMTSRQENGTVLGFTRALILAYVKPGKGKECVYRLKQTNPDFNLIDFTVDRYELDQVLSDNWITTPIEGTGNIAVSGYSSLLLGSGANVAIEADLIVLPVDSTDATADLTEFYYGVSSKFSTELSTNAHIYVGNTFIGAVDSIESDNRLTLTANGAAAAFNQGFSYSNQFNLSTPAGSGTISANTLSNTIVGVSTVFVTELHVGDVIYVAGNAIGTVNSIISNTSLHLGNLSTANVTAVSYTHTYRDPYTVPGQGDKYLKFPQVGVLP